MPADTSGAHLFRAGSADPNTMALRAAVRPHARHVGHCADELCLGECVGEPTDYAPQTEIGDLDPIETPDHWSGTDTWAEYAGAR